MYVIVAKSYYTCITNRYECTKTAGRSVEERKEFTNQILIIKSIYCNYNLSKKKKIKKKKKTKRRKRKKKTEKKMGK